MDVSIIIPTLNEPHINRILKHVRNKLPETETIVVDSSNNDQTVKLAKPYTDKIIKIDEQSRGLQLSAGTKEASNDILMFMHADHRLPQSAADKINQAFSNQNVAYAAFYKKFDTDNKMLRVLSTLNNIRSFFTSYIQGDNLIMVRKAVLKKIGGVPEIPIMEDVILSKKLKKYAKLNNKKFKLISDPVYTSARYFEENGALRSIFLMQIMKWKFFWGASPQKLQKNYY